MGDRKTGTDILWQFFSRPLKMGNVHINPLSIHFYFRLSYMNVHFGSVIHRQCLQNDTPPVNQHSIAVEHGPLKFHDLPMKTL